METIFAAFGRRFIVAVIVLVWYNGLSAYSTRMGRKIMISEELKALIPGEEEKNALFFYEKAQETE